MSHHVVVTQHATHLDQPPTLGFGDRLRRLRLDLGMEQRAFAAEIDIHPATLSRYELATEPPRVAPLVAAAIQLRYGSSQVDLRSWLLELPHVDSNHEPADYRRPRLALVAA